MKKLKEKIESNLKDFLEFIKTRLELYRYPDKPYKLIFYLIAKVSHHLEIIRKFIDKGYHGVYNFDFLALPKFSLEFQKEEMEEMPKTKIHFEAGIQSTTEKLRKWLIT